MRPFLLVTPLALTALGGCRDVTAPAGANHAAPISFVSPLALSTTVSSSTLAPGAIVTMTITITNVSNKTLTVRTTACSSRFVISTHDGKTVDRGNPVCTAMLGIATLAPGESVSVTESWDGLELVGGDAVTRVPAGEYFIRGSDFNGPVRSNAVAELTVLP
jgi:hypothetical protein